MDETNEDDLPLLFDDPDYKVALSYSGGKDSSVLLNLCRPYKDRFTVVWVNTGYLFPHIRRHIADTAQGFSFQEITHDLQPHREHDGIPTHVLPIDHGNRSAGGGIEGVVASEIKTVGDLIPLA